MWPVRPIKHLDRHPACHWLAAAGQVVLSRNPGMLVDLNLRPGWNKVLGLNLLPHSRFSARMMRWVLLLMLHDNRHTPEGPFHSSGSNTGSSLNKSNRSTGNLLKPTLKRNLAIKGSWQKEARERKQQQKFQETKNKCFYLLLYSLLRLVPPSFPQLYMLET